MKKAPAVLLFIGFFGLDHSISDFLACMKSIELANDFET